jgi:glycosyl transferase family 25
MDYHVFCIHHTDNASRKQRLLQQFEELDLEVEWIETYHPRDRSSWDHHGLSENSIGETSCALKHRDAMRRQVERGIELAVILEDDIELPDTFVADLDRWLREFRELHGDMLMIGVSFDLHVDRTEPGREVYEAPRPQTRSTHAYAVTLEAARVIAPDLERMPKGIGIDLNDILERRRLKMCWVEPGLRQLTMTGDMLSSIETRRTWRDRARYAVTQLRRRLAPATGRRA